VPEGQVQVRLLGPVDVLVGGAARPVHGTRRKSVLAVLALRAGEVVSTEHLVDVVWGGSPPQTATATLQNHVSYLRGLLGSRSAIAARPPGYMLAVGPDATDVVVAERLIRQDAAAADPVERLDRLQSAVGLWRGQPLADVAGHPWLDRQAERLADLRLAALHAVFEARLDLGEHEQLLPELGRLADEYPYDEQFCGQLMRALYRCGRQADALARYQMLRRSLGADLGIDPSPALRDLETRILRHDGAMAGPSPASRAMLDTDGDRGPLGLRVGPDRLTTEPEAVDGAIAALPLALVDMAGRVSSPVTVGRSEQLALLEAAGHRAAQGRPAVVLIAGEAGVGKSRLVDELAGRAERWGAQVLVGRCVALDEGGLPWAPVVDALRELVRSVEPPVLDALIGTATDDLGRLLPDLGRPGTGPAPEGGTAQARLLELLLDLFGRLGRETPLVLVFEDLHWADRASRDLVAFLARRLRGERLLLVLTYRTDELGRRHPLRPLLAELGRTDRVQRIDLRPFGRAELAAQLDAILAAPAPAALVDEILVRSDGNAFYAEELLAAWRRGEHAGLPGSLQDTLLTRVERLSGPAQAVLAAAAAAGRGVDHRLLAVVSGLAGTELADAVRETVAEQVLLAVPDGRGLTFRHALMREAIEAQLLPGERIRLHAELAAAITAHRDWAYGTEAEVAAELAYHWDAALDVERALAAAVEAGLAAERVYAFANAARHFERAVELWDRVPGTATVATLGRAAVLAHAAEDVHRTDDQIRAVALQRAALAAVDSAAGPVQAALLHERLGHYLLLAGDPETLTAYAESVRLLAQAPPSAVRARILAAHARALLLASRIEPARAVAEQARAMAHDIGAKLEEGRAEAALGAALTILGDPQSGIAHLHSARAVAEETVDIDGLGWSWISLVEAVASVGRLTDACALALEGAEIGRRLGMANMYGDYLEGIAAHFEFRLGRWDDADRRGREVVERDLGTSVKGVCLRLWRARLQVARGELQDARQLLDQVGPPAHIKAPVLGLLLAHGLAELALAEDRCADAITAVRDGLALAGDAEPHARIAVTALGLRALAEQAAALHARERPAAVENTRSEGDGLLANAQAAVTQPRHGTAPEAESAAWLRQCQAEHSRLHGRHDAAAWADVAAAWDLRDEPHAAAYARWRHAEALLSVGATTAEAAAPLGAAAQVAQRLGARPLLAEVSRLARRARIPLDSPDDTPAMTATFEPTRRDPA
jgi:DNA-binding SARP family transcriptional activator